LFSELIWIVAFIDLIAQWASLTKSHSTWQDCLFHWALQPCVKILKLRTVQMLHHPSSIVHCWSPLSLSSIGLLHRGPLNWTLAQLHHLWNFFSTSCWKLDGKWFEIWLWVEIASYQCEEGSLFCPYLSFFPFFF
jgi:hypothetical protein